MSEFLKHSACPKCNSSDAFALYAGGSGYCFSCGYYRPPTGSPYIAAAQLDTPHNMKDMPDDAGMYYSTEVLKWTSKYYISVEQLIQNNVLYSPSRNQLIFTFYEDSPDNQPGLCSPQGGESGFEKPCLWQARNFSKESKLKYYTQGEKEKVVPYFGQLKGSNNERSVVTIVEDCISAIRIASLGSVAVPCLGSTMGRDKLARLRGLLGPSSRYVVWLDSNMYDKAQQISQRLALLGSHTRVIWSEEDPKFYTDAQIKEFLSLPP